MNLRRDRGVRQQDLAKQAGVTPGALSKIEHGINAPRGRVIRDIARALGVPIEYLLDESMPYPYEPVNIEVPPSAENDRKKKVEVALEEKYLLEAMRSSDEVREAVTGIFGVPLEWLPVIHRMVCAQLSAKEARAVLRELKAILRE